MSTVVYWLADRTGCGQYRGLLPGTGLTERGHTVIADERLSWESLDRADVLIGQRIAKPGPSQLWQAIAREEGRKYRLVYELDDDVFALVDEIHNPNHKAWPSLLDNVRKNLACADVVTVSTDCLADVVSSHTSAPVRVIPNAVPQSLLDSMLPLRNKPNTIGWSGSPTHDGDWSWHYTAEKILDWFDRSAFSEGWMLRTFGALPAPLDNAMEGRRLWHVHNDGTSDLSMYYKMINRWFDIGLAPLAPTAFNRSKSDLRLLELAALGIPWIASDFGPYSRDRNVRGGLHVSARNSWRECLTAVATDADMRRELRTQGRRWAHTRTVDAVLPRWEEAFGLTG